MHNLDVGCVNLMGSHPSWPKTGYAFDNETNDVTYADPLVVEASQRYVQYLHEKWLADVQESGAAEIGPFTVQFAPDYHDLGHLGRSVDDVRGVHALCLIHARLRMPTTRKYLIMKHTRKIEFLQARHTHQ